MTDREDTGRYTQYGFQWGPLDVVRIAHFPGRGRVLGLKTQHDELEVFVTNKGRRIRAWKDGKELS